MKANAPNKIYLHVRANNEIGTTWHGNKIDSKDIEYTQSNTFIEKISKSALVAEIEKLKGKVSDSSSYCNGWQHALRMLELSLGTLEVKEVDLEKEIDTWYQNEASKEFENVVYEDIEKCARHFFELGLKTQKGEQQ